MIRRRDDAGERAVHELLERLAASVPEPGPGELAGAARRAAAEQRRAQPRPAPGRVRRPWRPLRLRWTAAAAGAILVATGLGFGIGQWLTPSGSARPSPAGLGFLPADGWTVLQAGGAGSVSEARAVAANVPLHPADRPGAEPFATLRSLAPAGVVVVATLTSRGDPAVDARFPVRSLPLRFVDARLASAPQEPVASRRSLTEYRLRAGIRGYNVDVSLHFGSTPPSVSALEAAEQQLQRLVVSPVPVTLVLPSRVVRDFDSVTAHGSVSSGRADEHVTVQFRQCGLLPYEFRDVAEVTTTAGGGWSAELPVDANGTFRAVHGTRTGNEVAVRKRSPLNFAPVPNGTYRVSIAGKLSFVGRLVVVQRYDERRRTWSPVRQVTIAEGGGAGSFVWSWTEAFPLALPGGTRVRAVLPAAQAGPCYLPATSQTIRLDEEGAR